MAYLPKGWEGSDMVRLAKPSLIKALELLSLGSSELPCKEAGTPPMPRMLHGGGSSQQSQLSPAFQPPARLPHV